MIWVILAVLGVPLWLCAAGLSVLVMRNRAIRHRPGNVKVRRRRQGKSRWTRGYGVWVHDVFAFRGSPAAWAESLIPVREAVTLSPSESDLKKLRRLGAATVDRTAHRRRWRARRFRDHARARPRPLRTLRGCRSHECTGLIR